MININKISTEIQIMYRAEQTAFVIDSFLHGNKPISIYANERENPTTGLVWDQSHCFYCGGDAENEEDYRIAAQFLKRNILTGSARERLRVVKINYTNNRWEAALMECLQEYNPNIYWRTLFKHHLETLPIMESKRGMMVSDISMEIINDNELANRESMIDEIVGMWGSVDDFMERGFGYCAIDHKQIVNWCTAEYMSPGVCGIGIETVETHKGCGIASETAAHFVNQCNELKVVPYWDCWKDNIPSVRVAEKTGFQKVLDYKVIFVRFGS